jgi:hypothetical protein
VCSAINQRNYLKKIFGFAEDVREYMDVRKMSKGYLVNRVKPPFDEVIERYKQDIRNSEERFNGKNIEPKPRSRTTETSLDEQIEFINQYHRKRKRSKEIYMQDDIIIIE